MAVSRRNFLGSAGALAAVELTNRTPPASGSPTADSPTVVVGKAKSFAIGTPVAFHYPDDSSPALAVRLSKPIAGGVGPHGDIVAYSQLCVHKGCPVDYNAQREVFVCPCHYSVYDAEKTGEVVIGHATTNLPRITLSYDAHSDAVTATGVQGLVYGHFSDRKVG
jgi:arsenite oxidase small subunit